MLVSVTGVELLLLHIVLVMDHDSDDSELMQKVFAVDDDDDDVDLALPPTSGQEYLRRVMWVKLCVIRLLNVCHVAAVNLKFLLSADS